MRAGALLQSTARSATVRPHGWTRGGRCPHPSRCGTFTPSVVLDLARHDRPARRRRPRGDRGPGDLLAGPVPRPRRRRARRGPDQPGQRARLPVQPRQPAGRAASTCASSAAVDRGMGLGPLRPARARPPRTCAARGSASTCPPPASRSRSTRSPTRSASPATDYELVTLGSTPRRLEALLAGDCDATMLNAGNELVAERAGCSGSPSVADVVAPYLGTVVAVAGDEHGSPRPRSAGRRADVDGRGASSAAALDDEARRGGRAPARPRRRAGAQRYVDAAAQTRRGAGRPTASSTRRRCATLRRARAGATSPTRLDGRDVLAGAGRPGLGVTVKAGVADTGSPRSGCCS